MAETNPTMAIWLGKQYLNQRERAQIDHIDVKVRHEQGGIT
jgi:hypothetical protein